MKPSTRKYLKYGSILAGTFLILIYFSTSIYHFPDGTGYFSYMSSLWHDNDLNFVNDFSKLRISLPLAITETGYITNLWPIGTAVVLSPFYLFGKMIKYTDSCDILLRAATNFGSTLFGIMTCFLIYQLLSCLKISVRNRIIAASCSFFGTPLFFYSCFIPNSPHTVSAFLVSLLFFTWVFTFDSYTRYSRWVFLGLVSGLMTSVRTNDSLFITIIAVELLYRILNDRDRYLHYIRYSGVFMASVIAGFLPQFLAWKFLYGSFFASPQGFNVSLSNFSMLDLIFSKYHGLLLWTPVYFIAITGLLVRVRQNVIVYGSSIVAFFLQVFTISLLTAWWGGYSFGIRYFTNSCVIVGLGTGLLLEYAEGKKRAYFLAVQGICILFAAWTFILAIMSFFGHIDLQKLDLDFRDIITLRSILDSFYSFISMPFGKKYFPPLFAFYIAGLSFVFFMSWMFNSIRQLKFKLVNMLMLLLLLLFSYRVITSHYNGRNDLNFSREFMDSTITKPDLNRIFLLYDLKERVKYHEYNDNKKKAVKEAERIKAIRMDTAPADNLYQRIISQPPVSKYITKVH